MNDTHTRLTSLACALVTALLAGCVHERLPVSDEFAPICLRDNQPVTRIAELTGHIDNTNLEYRWRTKSLQTVESEVITGEILDFLGWTQWQAGLTRLPPREASWYWSPHLSEPEQASDRNAEILVTTRPYTVIILGLQPTIAIRIDRPTENSSFGVTFPWHNTDWWGWSRIILTGGIADGRLVPTSNCPSDDIALAEIVIPSLGVIAPIDLRESGSFDWGSGVATWECVVLRDGRSGVLFDLANNSVQAKITAD